MDYFTEAQNVTGTESYKKTQEKNKTSNNNYGNTIGKPELSDKAKDYYEKLKKKYSNMDFILVSRDKKEEAQANAGKYANKNRMVVLIDEDKIERMATDEKYRKQYESIISGATTKMSQLKESLGSNASAVKTYGMQVNDGGNASFFAVIDKSMAAQKKRIEQKAAKKAEDRKEAKKAADQKRAEARKEKRAEDRERLEGSEDTVTITANSVEELIRKINDMMYTGMSDYVLTDAEKQVGQHFDSRW